MGYNGGYNGGGQARGGFGRGGGRGGKFEPRPGSGTLFVKSDKRNQQAPDYDGYFIPDRDIRAGEKIKLVGWDKQGSGAPMITLKLGRDRQDAPGYNDGGYQQGQPQGGYQQPPQGGYGPGPGYNNGGYQGQPQGYQQPPQGGYRPAPAPGSYQGGGYGGHPVQTYQPPAGQPPVGQAPNAAPAAAPAGPAYPQPPAEDDLPF